MKKALVLFFSLCLLLSMAACGGEGRLPGGEPVPPPEEASPPAEEASPQGELSPVIEPVPAGETAPEDEPALEAAPSYEEFWGGKWYGWGVYYSATGQYADMEATTWDVVAQIDVDGDSGSLRIWDITDLNEAELSAQVSFRPGHTEHGKMLCQSGGFIDHAFPRGAWACDPGSRPEGRLEHTICFSFTFYDPEDDSDSVLIYYVLRPWGMLWDDVARADTGEMLYEDMMPSHYEDWYLPQLEQDGAA